MAKTKVSEWSSTPGSNTDIDGINLAEGMLPSDVNNALREMMSQLKNQQAGLDGDNFTVDGSLILNGATSGATTFLPIDAATATITLPSATGTLATLAGSETLTNKALNGSLGATTPSTIVGTTGSFSGDVGINTAIVAGSPLTIKSKALGAWTSIRMLDGAGGTNYWDIGAVNSSSNVDLLFSMAGSAKMTLDASGNLLVGTTSGVTKKLNVAGVIKNTGGGIGGDVGAGQGEMGGDGTNGCQITGKGSTNDVTLYSSGGSIAARVPTGTQNFTVVGALSKGSGSFRIDHPLPQLEATHQLVHSFIEGPQADLIYRGKVNLVNGTATVNIDEASTMTEGTFIELCRDVQCFTTNESDWTAIRGSVTNNILTIEAQDNTSTASISWMVIGERQDKHILETDWTDENGKVIVEPLKVIDEVLEAK